MDTISREDLKASLDKGAVVLVETLPKFMYDQGHIPGAINLPPADISKAASVLPDKNAPIVVYCASPT